MSKNGKIIDLAKSREEREQKEIAKKLIAVVEDVLKLFEEKDLQLFEGKTVASLLNQRLDTLAQNKVQPMKIKELTKKKQDDNM